MVVHAAIQVSIKQESLGAKLLNLSVDVQDGADNQSSLNDMLSKISAVVSATYTITDQVKKNKLHMLSVHILFL